MFLFELIDLFNKNKISYAIVGGYALAMHGIVRATIDVDIVLNLKLRDFEQAEKLLLQSGLQSRIPVRSKDIINMREEYIKNRNLIAWSFVDPNNPTRQVDLLINKDLSTLKTQVISVGTRKIVVANLEELLKMKQESRRPKDLIDIENIKLKLNEKKK